MVFETVKKSNFERPVRNNLEDVSGGGIQRPQIKRRIEGERQLGWTFKVGLFGRGSGQRS